MTPWQWFQENTLTLFGALIVLSLIVRYRAPSIQSWGMFLDSFESKGGQILLLFAADLIFVALVIKFNKSIDPSVMATITGILGGINGAFLGAMGARAGSNGSGTPKPDTLTTSFAPPAQPPEEKKP
jgi:membrane protein YqaA with SNARE-associated domain